MKPRTPILSAALAATLAAAALLAAAAPGHAAPRIMEAVFLDEDGRPLEVVPIQELQISVTGGNDGINGDNHNQVSITMDSDTFRNAGVLSWMARCDEKTGLLLRSASGNTSDSFLLNGIGSCSFNISQSGSYGNLGQSMLSVSSRRLTVNGNTLN